MRETTSDSIRRCVQTTGAGPWHKLYIISLGINQIVTTISIVVHLHVPHTFIITVQFTHHFLAIFEIKDTN